MTTRSGARTGGGRSRVRRWALPVARVVVIAVIAGLVAWRLDWSALQDAFMLEHTGFVVAAVVANFASVVFKGFAWKGIVDALPRLKAKTRIQDLLGPLFIGFLFNTVLAARVGEIAKVLLVRRKMLARGEDRVRTTTLLGSVLAENIVSTICWVALVVGIGIFLPLPSYAWFASAALGVGCLTVLIVCMLARPGRQVPPWLRTGPLWARALRAIARLWGAVRESHVGLKDPKRMALVAIPSLATWLAQWLGIYCTLVAFGLERVGWGGAGLLLVTITLAQTFPVLPGNLVVFQAAAVLPLTASYGVGAEAAIAFSILLQVTEVIVGVAVGFLFLLAEGVGFRQLRREAEEESQKEAAYVDTLGGV